jgi:hypothetical protein
MKQKNYYSVQESPKIGSIPDQVNAVHTLTKYLFKSHFNIILHLRTRTPSGLVPPDFPIKIVCAFLISPVRAACLTHFIFLDLFTLIVFIKEHKL